MAKLLSDNDAAELRKLFTQRLNNQVFLRLFVQDPDQPGDCEYCADTEQIVRELAELNNQIKVILHKSPTDSAEVAKYHVERVPALILEKEEGVDSGVRFYGVPSGYEFGCLIEDMLDLANGESKLPADLLEQVAKVQKDVTVKVFVTPT